jgi:hypothetical protein
MENKYIDFKNSEILKMISDRFSLLSWALSSLYGYLNVKFSSGLAIFIIIATWLILQTLSLQIATYALKYKKE